MPDFILNSWSFSRFRNWSACPAQLKYQGTSKQKVTNAAMERGTDVHGSLEAALKSRAMPRKMHPVAELARGTVEELRALRKSKEAVVSAELSRAHTSKWKPTQFFAADAWLRLKLDVHERHKDYVVIRDWKTGRPHPEWDNLQGSLYALSEFKADPKAMDVRVVFHFIEQDVCNETSYQRKRDEAHLTRDWLARVKPMLADRLFRERPGYQCRWCPFRKELGGPCKSA